MEKRIAPLAKRGQVPIELNDHFQHALEIMEYTNRNVFVTGRAGTGKSTLMEYFRNTTKKRWDT